MWSVRNAESFLLGFTFSLHVTYFVDFEEKCLSVTSFD